MFLTIENKYIIFIFQNFQNLIPSRTSRSSKKCNDNLWNPNKLRKPSVLEEKSLNPIGIYRLYIAYRMYLVWSGAKQYKVQFRVYSGFPCSEFTCHLPNHPTSPTLGRFHVYRPRKKGQHNIVFFWNMKEHREIRWGRQFLGIAKLQVDQIITINLKIWKALYLHGFRLSWSRHGRQAGLMQVSASS